MFERDTKPIIAPRSTRGQGTHLATFTNDDLDEVVDKGSTVLSVGQEVYCSKYGYGKVKDIWNDKRTNAIKFKVNFEVKGRKVIFPYPDAFVDKKVFLVKR